MTAQIMERLFYEGDWLPLATTPLEHYLKSTGTPRPPSNGFSTSLWRGYVGSWVIEKDRLCLVGLNVNRTAERFSQLRPDAAESKEQWLSDTEALLMVFPEAEDKVFAVWFSGTLRCPLGERLAYIHGGFGSTYDRDLLIDVTEGIVTRVRNVEGTPGTPQRDLGYVPVPSDPPNEQKPMGRIRMLFHRILG